MDLFPKAAQQFQGSLSVWLLCKPATCLDVVPNSSGMSRTITTAICNKLLCLKIKSNKSGFSPSFHPHSILFPFSCQLHGFQDLQVFMRDVATDHGTTGFLTTQGCCANHYPLTGLLLALEDNFPAIHSPQRKPSSEVTTGAEMFPELTVLFKVHTLGTRGVKQES